jgi:hypothetical protein
MKKVDTLTVPERQGSVVEYMYYLKRNRMRNGPYPDVSFFESANRLLSDLVILFGVRQILNDPQIGSIHLPFHQYNVKLGGEKGFDILAENGDDKFVGEAYNVAPSYFPEKSRLMKNKLKREKEFNYKMLMFNSNAVDNPHDLLSDSSDELIFLPVDWQRGVAEYRMLV